jgi:hypothetical protein
MPKLNTLQIEDRINDYYRRMRDGEEIAIRDIKAILNWVDGSLIQWMDDEWEQQQQLRKQKRARTEEEKAALGYKTKKDIQLEALNKARDTVSQQLLKNLEADLAAKEQRQARVFLDGFEAAKKNHKSFDSAFAFANNELTRAGIRRVDGVMVDGISERDKEVWAIEDALEEQFYNEATKEEQEQYDMLYESNGEIPRWRERKAKKNGKK